MGKVSALLAFLAVGGERPRSRDMLAALLWEDRAEEQARSSLRQALSAIRRAVPVGTIEAEHDWVRLRGVSTDVREFEAAIAVGEARSLIQAVTLYRGDLLEGFHVRSSPFDTWLAAERQVLQAQAVGALVALLEKDAGREAVDLHVSDALRILARDDTQEPLHRALMRHYATRGHRVAALRQYFHCRDALGRELGTSPDAETEDLYQHILRQERYDPGGLTGQSQGRP